jgi:hypothetical protein
MKLNPRFISPLLSALLLALSGCYKEENVSVSYLAFNRTTEHVLFITINGQGGILHADAMGGGGGEMCCVTIPKRWHPGLQATVGWQAEGNWELDAQGKEVIRDGRRVLIPAPRQSAVAVVHPYSDDEGGGVQLHFLPGGKVEIVRTSLMPTHRNFKPEHLRQSR